jgi:hypothetical protein
MFTVLQRVASDMGPDPRGRNANGDSHDRVQQTQDRLQPRLVGAQASHDHNYRGSDCGRDAGFRPTDKHYSDSADADERGHAQRVKWKNQQVNQAEDEAYRRCCHAHKGSTQALRVTIVEHEDGGNYCPHPTEKVIVGGDEVRPTKDGRGEPIGKQARKCEQYGTGKDFDRLG